MLFHNTTTTTYIYTPSLHDALPISEYKSMNARVHLMFVTANKSCVIAGTWIASSAHAYEITDRKSTRLNSSHVAISYAVFCLKKKINNYICSSCSLLTSHIPMFYTF